MSPPIKLAKSDVEIWSFPAGYRRGGEQKGKHKTNTNDAIKQVHAALVAKAKSHCAVDGSNRLALDIGAKLADYGKEWAAAFR